MNHDDALQESSAKTKPLQSPVGGSADSGPSSPRRDSVLRSENKVMAQGRNGCHSSHRGLHALFES